MELFGKIGTAFLVGFTMMWSSVTGWWQPESAIVPPTPTLVKEAETRKVESSKPADPSFFITNGWAGSGILSTHILEEAH